MTDLFKSMTISSSGLAAQRMRMNILSSNLANAETTRTQEGGPYKRKDVVFTADAMGTPFEDFLDGTFLTQLKQVRVTDIHEDQQDSKRVFEPNHPDADKNGYVEKPNVQVMTEMVNMIAATRAYEANATALNSAKDMAMKALEIGR